ncbi:SDR family oxidoreductase [uncultured Maritimibacter sp.]|uniref:SDR family NAD(P)-dependent oxidoreductase n=1 Tax=uncultured Maritimibacter sp. TaxID=991866 RepID=UPI002594C9F9|nr:SDR family oxidoreductase [uncultured Maritimibacter sp.]
MGWALITGASSGLGLEFAKLAAADGWNLVISARREDELRALADTLPTEVVVVTADLAEPGAADRLWRAANDGRSIDLLVNNAGFGVHGRFATCGDERERGSVTVNMVAVTELMQNALKQFRAAGTKGKVLNVASLAGYMPSPNMAIYHATKSYVLTLSEAVHYECKRDGITVTALCPGPSKTNFFGAAGIDSAWLTSFLPMLAPDVIARAGWRALEAGKRVEVPGFVTKLVVLSAKITPRGLLARMNGFFWSGRG